MPVISAIRGCSSVGRAPALQAGGHEFESHHLHSGSEGTRTVCESFTAASGLTVHQGLLAYGHEH